MYSYTIGSSGAMEKKVCITLLNVQHMEDKPRTCLLINFFFFFPSYFHFPSVEDSQVYLKSQYRQDLLLGVIAVDIQYTHRQHHSIEPVYLCI